MKTPRWRRGVMSRGRSGRRWRAILKAYHGARSHATGGSKGWSPIAGRTHSGREVATDPLRDARRREGPCDGRLR
jgi:hypothetical protein